MSGGQRENAFPTRQVLQIYKKKALGAQKGYDLLKKKSDALTVRFRALLKQIYHTKSTMGDEMKEASFSLAEAVWAADSKFKSVILFSLSLDSSTGCLVFVCLRVFRFDFFFS